MIVLLSPCYICSQFKHAAVDHDESLYEQLALVGPHPILSTYYIHKDQICPGSPQRTGVFSRQYRRGWSRYVMLQSPHRGAARLYLEFSTIDGDTVIHSKCSQSDHLHAKGVFHTYPQSAPNSP